MNDAYPSSSSPSSTPIADAVNAGKACVDAAPDAVKAAACEVKGRLAEAGRQSVAMVRKYPVESAVIAVGVGALIWWFLSRRQGSGS